MLDSLLKVVENKSVEELEIAWLEAPVWQMIAEEVDTGAGPSNSANLGVRQDWTSSNH